MQLPKEFIDRTKPLLEDEWNDFIQALESSSPTSIRLNNNKIQKEMEEEKVLWCNTGFYLEQRPQFTFDPLLHAGGYYVQEASSMIIEQAIKQLINGDIRALDMCAAPGGKSTLVSSLLSKDSLLVSNEIVRSRANILAENLMKWGNPNIIVSNNKPGDYGALTHYFDLLLIDAPCSGEGMFRKDEQAIEEWSVNNVMLCAQRQRDIISAVWDALKPNGYLFYSTCTYNREENEEIVAWICDTYDAEVVELKIEKEWGISNSEVNGAATYHFYPHKTKGEGLYFAVIQKKEDDSLNPLTIKDKSDSKGRKNKANLEEYQIFLSDESLKVYEEDELIKAFPQKYYTDLNILKKKLNIIHGGVLLGERKGKSFIPHQSLALSNVLNRDSVEIYEVDWLTAISYLRKEALILSEAPKGILLLTYKDRPIGFVKNLGNRANNLYPNEWRIRSSQIPSDIVDVLKI